MWALDDKQREEHFRLDDLRRRAEVDRARRIVVRIKLLPMAVGEPAPDAANTTPAVAQTTPMSSPSRGKGLAVAAPPAEGGAAGKNPGGEAIE